MGRASAHCVCSMQGSMGAEKESQDNSASTLAHSGTPRSRLAHWSRLESLESGNTERRSRHGSVKEPGDCPSFAGRVKTIDPLSFSTPKSAACGVMFRAKTELEF